MFVACGIWCLADVSSVSPSSEQTLLALSTLLTRKTKQCPRSRFVQHKTKQFCTLLVLSTAFCNIDYLFFINAC